MIDQARYFGKDEKIRSMISVGASRNLFGKHDIVYEVVFSADIPWAEMTERVIKDLQESLAASKAD